MIEKLVVSCGTRNDVDVWLEVLRSVTSGKPAPNPVSVKPQSIQVIIELFIVCVDLSVCLFA